MDISDTKPDANQIVSEEKLYKGGISDLNCDNILMVLSAPVYIINNLQTENDALRAENKVLKETCCKTCEGCSKRLCEMCTTEINSTGNKYQVDASPVTCQADPEIRAVDEKN
jgi:hypothetical protein